MKTFETENHYDVLQIAPDAGRNEIRHAYRQALALYDAESVATYALFSDQERSALLDAIEKAFETLNDDGLRAAYDQMLIDNGQLDTAALSERARRELAARSQANGVSREESLCQWAAKRAEAPEMRRRLETVLAEPRISGPQLKELRDAYGIELSEIYAATRINRDVMQAIEADDFDALPAPVYLKQFLKNLARILQLDPTRLAGDYLAAMGRK